MILLNNFIHLYFAKGYFLILIDGKSKYEVFINFHINFVFLFFLF